MKHKRIIVIGLLSLAVGLAIRSTNLPTPSNRGKLLHTPAPREPRAEQQAGAEPVKQIPASRDSQQNNGAGPQLQPAPADTKAGEQVLDELTEINEQTIVGTEWGDDKLKLEFGPRGKLLIGGNVRANWRIESGRVKLYSDDGREVHWLDIDGNRLTWNGEPVGRFR